MKEGKRKEKREGTTSVVPVEAFEVSRFQEIDRQFPSLDRKERDVVSGQSRGGG